MLLAAALEQRTGRPLRLARARTAQGALLPRGIDRLPHRRRGRRSPRRRSVRPAGGYAPRRDGRTGRLYVRGSLGPVKVAFHVDQLWASVPGGIGTYTRQLLTALPAEDPSTELVAFRSRATVAGPSA